MGPMECVELVKDHFQVHIENNFFDYQFICQFTIPEKRDEKPESGVYIKTHEF